MTTYRAIAIDPKQPAADLRRIILPEPPPEVRARAEVVEVASELGWRVIEDGRIPANCLYVSQEDAERER